MDSIFMEDTKKHLSVNLDSGLWQDFKASESGNFPQLVSYIDSISVDSAVKYIRTQLFSCPENLFKVPVEKNSTSVSENTVSEIFEDFEPLNLKKLDASNLLHRLARKFIIERKLEKWDFYICAKGKYSNRLIIPYTHNGEPFFFQGRNLSTYGMKYLNPSRENGGVKSSDILFPWDESMDYVFVAEGPLDAISLRLNGYNATCTQGSHLSYEQARQMKGKRIIFAYDSDEAGKTGVSKALRILRNKNTNNFYVLKTPSKFKDWNEVHSQVNHETFSALVESSINKVDLSFVLNEELEKKCR